MPLSLNDLIEALLFVDAAKSVGDGRAIICRRTGKIHLHSDFADIAESDDELPDDVDNEEKYVELPDKHELDLGKPLALAFAREHLPDDFDEVRDIFDRRGAYSKFKTLLARRRAVDRWYAFENAATERALRDWCALHALELVD